MEGWVYKKHASTCISTPIYSHYMWHGHKWKYGPGQLYDKSCLRSSTKKLYGSYTNINILPFIAFEYLYAVRSTGWLLRGYKYWNLRSVLRRQYLYRKLYGALLTITYLLGRQKIDFVDSNLKCTYIYMLTECSYGHHVSLTSQRVIFFMGLRKWLSI